MMCRRHIAVVDGGTSYHRRTLYDAHFRHYFSETIYVRDLPQAALAHCDALMVPDRTHPALLRAAAPRIAAYLANGGTVVACAETAAHTWLPGVRWTPRPTNFWWWKTPGATLGLRIAQAQHPLFQHLTLAEATWHYHGLFTAPAAARVLIAADDGAVLYEDAVTTAGRMIVTSLDPFYHYGSYFMPVTEKFLDGFLTWLHRSLER